MNALNILYYVRNICNITITMRYEKEKKILRSCFLKQRYKGINDRKSDGTEEIFLAFRLDEHA